MQTSFILTHLSLILILLGSVVKFQLGVKGGVYVYEGKSVNYFLTQLINRQGKLDYVKKDLPFSIALDDFILEKNEPKFRILNMDNDAHTYRLAVEGFEGLLLQADVERVTIGSGQVRELVVRLQADPANLGERSSHIRFRVQAEDSARLVATEEARFLGPIVR